jgi:hypothetical protein
MERERVKRVKEACDEGNFGGLTVPDGKCDFTGEIKLR